MIYWVKRKIQQIRNILSWLPIIWNTFDWDYSYSINVFRFQLERQAKLLESNKTWSACAKKNASKIRTAIKLMDKVYEEEYALEYQDIIEKKYGKKTFKLNDIPQKPGYSSLEMIFKGSNYSEAELKLIKEEEYLLMKQSNDKQNKAHRILWAFIEHNIRNWWD